MPKYINVDKLIEEIEDLPATMSVCLTKDEAVGMRRMKESAIDAAKRQPAADVEPVVKCRDCIYFDHNTCDRWADGTLMHPYDYCSRGVILPEPPKEEDND